MSVRTGIVLAALVGALSLLFTGSCTKNSVTPAVPALISFTASSSDPNFQKTISCTVPISDNELVTGNCIDSGDR
jgi:hypothetical protein